MTNEKERKNSKDISFTFRDSQTNYPSTAGDFKPHSVSGFFTNLENETLEGKRNIETKLEDTTGLVYIGPELTTISTNPVKINESNPTYLSGNSQVNYAAHPALANIKQYDVVGPHVAYVLGNQDNTKYKIR